MFHFLSVLSQSNFREPANLLERDTKNTKKNKTVRQFILIWLGLSDLAKTLNEVQKNLDTLDQKVGALSIESEPDLSDVESRLDDLEEKVNDIDPDDFVRSNDLDDQIDMWMQNSEYCDSDRVRDIIEEETEELSDNLEEKVAEAIEETDLTDKVEEVVKKMDKASFGDTEELKAIVTEVLKTLKFKVE